MKILPDAGSVALAAIWLLANASGKLSSMPITSPVERISGPRMMSTPANLLNGKTLSLTEKYVGTTSSNTPSSSSVLPTITSEASRANGTPVGQPHVCTDEDG